MKSDKKSIWDKRLRASASALALCCILPCAAVADSSIVKLRPPAAQLPWLAAKKSRASEKPESVTVYLSALENPDDAKEENSELASVLKLRPPAAEESEDEEAEDEAPATKDADKAVVAAKDEEDPAMRMAQEMMIDAAVDKIRLHPPVDPSLPWYNEKQAVAMAPAGGGEAEAHAEPPVAVADNTKLTPLSPEPEKPSGIALQPVSDGADKQIAAIEKHIQDTKFPDAPAQQIASADHYVWRDDKEAAANITAENMPENKLVLLPPVEDDDEAEAETQTVQLAPAAQNTKTVIAKLETVTNKNIVFEVKNASQEDAQLALVAPAAGEPSELMATKLTAPSVPAAAPSPSPAPAIVPDANAPLPKLEIPDAPVKALPDSADPKQPSLSTVPASVPAPAPEPKLSEETKGIIERLPGELRRGAKGKDEVSIERSRKKGADDVKKHEAYGIKISVKRPKMDVFRALESAYNSLIAGDQQYAITLYKEVLDHDHENTLALFGLATTYHRAGQIQLARPLYAQLLTIDPQNVEGLNNFLVLLADEAPGEALKELEKLRESHPGFSPVPAQMALIHQKNGDYAKAASEMGNALAISPENTKYQYNMAIIYDKMGDWREAARWYQNLITAHERGEKIPGDAHEIQQRLTFIRSNTSSAQN